jgi:riboflavin transporter FmnP
MVHIAILAALATVFMFFDFPLPFFPPFLKLDLSDAIVFIAGLILGPGGIVCIVGFRSILFWLLRGSETGLPIGIMAGMISSLSFSLSAYFIAQKLGSTRKSTSNIIIGLGFGTVCMSVLMFCLNYVWITPFYFSFAGWPLPDNYTTYMLMYIPFNIIKGGVNSLLVYFLLPYARCKK